MTSVTCRLLRLAPLLALCVAVHARAQQTMYKCFDDHGHLELTDTNKRGCKPLDLPGFVTTNPPPHNPAPPPRTRQGSAPAAPGIAPASFPRVGAAEQRARDDDRRAILAEELRTEQQKLVDLKSGFNNGEPARLPDEKDPAKYKQRVTRMRDDIARSEQNIEALKREIASVR